MKSWDSGYKRPCILEHCLTDKWKAKQLTKAFSKLKFKIELYSDGRWFDIVKE